MALAEDVLDDFFKRIEADSRVPASLSLALRDLLSQEALDVETLVGAIAKAEKLGHKNKGH